MDYTDASYFSALNPMTPRSGLSSIAPTFGMLNRPAQPAPISMNLPAPPSIQGAQAYFGNWLPGAARDTSEPGPSAIADQVAKLNLNPTSMPKFDSFYPNESMMALRNWLAPQVSAGADKALANRGIYSSGLGQYEQEKAMDYLGSIAPYSTPQGAFEADMGRLYGTDFARSLAGGSPAGNTTMHGGSPFAGGPFAGDYNFDHGPIPPSIPGLAPGSPTPSSEGALLPFPSWGHEFWTGVQPGPAPSYGAVDYARGVSYASPGYLYDPSVDPSTRNLPWLAAPQKPGLRPIGTS